MQVFKLKITEKQEPLHMSNFNQYSHRLQLVMFFSFHRMWAEYVRI